MEHFRYPPSREQQETDTPRAAATRSLATDSNLPLRDLLGDRELYLKICVPLYKASIRGDWEAAHLILEKHQGRGLVGCAITLNYDTPLHIAASAKSSRLVDTFVQNLVGKMTREQLELKNDNGNTALCIAAAGGNVQTVKTMLVKNPILPDIPGSNGMMPLYMATLFGNRDMVNYLYLYSSEMTGEHWSDSLREWTLEKCVEADLFDIAFKIVSKWPILAKSRDVLKLLARKKDAFRVTNRCFIWRIIPLYLDGIQMKVGPAETEKSGDAMKLLRIIWAEILKLSVQDIDYIIKGPVDEPTTSGKVQKDVQEQKSSATTSKQPLSLSDDEETSGKPRYSSGVLFVAAEMGNTEFLVELIDQYPDLIWKVNVNNQTIFHVAVSHRHEGIYNLIHEIGSMKDMITPLKDEEGNNMLHLVGKCPNNEKLQVVSGVALQLQRELLWFKEVEEIIPPSYREMKNDEGLTPHELFSKEHKDLMAAGEKWMKETASQSMVVAVLIATIVFAAAFTVPGGYDQDDGIPKLLHNKSLVVFVISDAISLTFSTISLIIFLSILTSRYAEHDFLHVLPERLMRGLAALFISIAAMMVTFCVSFFLLYKNSLIWIPILITITAYMPVSMYASLHYGLLGDVYYSTYGSKNFFKPKNLHIHYRNPQL